MAELLCSLGHPKNRLLVAAPLSWECWEGKGVLRAPCCDARQGQRHHLLLLLLHVLCTSLFLPQVCPTCPRAIPSHAGSESSRALWCGHVPQQL